MMSVALTRTFAFALSTVVASALVAGPAWAEDKAAATAPAADVPKGMVLPEVVGQWKWGSISPTSFWDTTTGKYAGNARSMGSFFDFKPDGTYSQMIYIATYQYGWSVQVWTYHEGTVTFERDGTFTLHPAKGRYKGADNRVAKNNFDRPMGEDDLKKSAGPQRWAFKRDGEKTVLMMGSTAEAMSPYEKWKE